MESFIKIFLAIFKKKKTLKTRANAIAAFSPQKIHYFCEVGHLTIRDWGREHENTVIFPDS